MSTLWKELVKAAALTGTPDSVYEAPSATYATITAVSANNPTAAALTVDIFIVPPGVEFAAGQRVASKNIAANSPGQFPEVVNHKLEPGAHIYATGNGATLTISGAENVPNT